MSKVQQDASDIKIEFLELVTPAETFDLQRLFVSMNIYEDLFGGSVTIDLFLNDSINLPYKAPILGEEYLNFVISSKSVTGNAKQRVELNPGPMYIVSITDRHLTKDRQQLYVLHFTSEQDIVNSNTTVSRSFRGKTIGTIVNILLNDYIDPEKAGRRMFAAGSRRQIISGTMAVKPKGCRPSSRVFGPSMVHFLTGFIAPVAHRGIIWMGANFPLAISLRPKSNQRRTHQRAA